MLPNSPGRTNEDFSTLKPKTNLPVTDRDVTYGQDERTISTTDLKGIIISVNDVFARISGFNREDLIGSSHNIICHPDLPPLAFENFLQTLKAGKPWIRVVNNRRKNGDFFWVHAYVSPFLRESTSAGSCRPVVGCWP
ncbi:hypothetical protein A3197_02510 [Candidatus Thiodiazotropha endoloripes]|nr:hypothetical protein A3197_02510 [Candidatus Thiodiazotropha endoloripes]